ncbi:MAG: beta-ketoacyl-[acyl-carrier-protein] synthase II [Chloroflexi bacterium]|nr:MAG: beta-ketoacyl-[acyl-carrier-protein] synthase II [Chloroflexota bacterium]
MNPRVVVTGMGIISPVGLDLRTAWHNLLSSRSGIQPITAFDACGFDVRIAGEAHGFDPLCVLSAKEARRTDRFVQFAAAALEEALVQSRLTVGSNAYEIGAIIGSGVGGIGTYTTELDILNKKGPRRVSPFLIPSITVDVPSVYVALRTGAKGPNFGLASACSTGADAIGQAFEAIRRGHAKAMFSGGFEAAITPIGIAAFDQMRALSHLNDDPGGASRPFDGKRDGFVMAEGGALLVLEALEFALRRGAEPLAEILSYASTSDAVHLTSPDMDGCGAAVCMSLAMQRARIRPEDVIYINTHGTGTPSGDSAETRAIKLAFGERAYQLLCSSTKSMTGHMLAGAGAFEAAVCIQALRTGVVPPTINLHNLDPECDLDYVPNRAQKVRLRFALSNAFGFGGHNSCLIFKKYVRRARVMRP